MEPHLELHTESEPPSTFRRRLLQDAWDLCKIFIITLLVILPVRAYVAQPFFVKGESMEPTFHNNEYLIVDEFSSRFKLRPLVRGDVVVFQYPLDRSQHYIKRIIGLPNDRVIIQNGSISLVNKTYPQGIRLDEHTYLPEGVTTTGTIDITLGANEYFVLGDNRDHSSDSRMWGVLPRSLITGRVWVRVLPVARAGTFHAPPYGGTVAPLATEASSSVP